MSRTFITRSIALAFVLTLAGTASARRPPSLAAAQERVDRIFASCPQGRSTAGYRDMLARFSTEPQSVSGVSAPAFVAPPQKMDDHIVLSCTAGRIHSGSGYRDMLWRFRSEADELQLAGTKGPNTASLVAR